MKLGNIPFLAYLVGPLLAYFLFSLATRGSSFLPIGVSGVWVAGISALLGAGFAAVLPHGRFAGRGWGDKFWIYGSFLTFVAAGWATIVGGAIPKASTYLWGQEVRRELTIASKDQSRFRYYCNRLVVKEYQNLPLNHVCVSEPLWERATPGQTVVAMGIENNLGFRVERVCAQTGC